MNNQRRYGVYHLRDYNHPITKPARNSNFKRAMLLTVCVFMVLGILSIYSNQRANARAALQAEAARRHIAVEKLQAALPSLISTSPLVKFSIYISDANYNEVADYNSSVKSDAASTAKLLSASLFLSKVETGHYKLSQRIGGIAASAQLKNMVKMSDDQAWSEINSLLSHKELRNYANSLGLDSYNAETNTISASDMNKLTRLIYTGQLLNEAHTNLLLSHMRNTNYEEFHLTSCWKFI